MSTLYAGPWAGEFGWELCSWNPVLRHKAKSFDRVVVETVPGSEYLYEFADEIVINPHRGDYDMCSGKAANSPAIPEGATVFGPMNHWKGGGRAEFRAIKTAKRDAARHIPEKVWRRLGTEKPSHTADIMLAFRGPKTFKGRSFPEKVWPDDQSADLANMFLTAGYSVACYGGTDNYYAPGTEDLRGLSLEALAGTLRQAKLAVGPSSGTLHLASLCQTPHVTWYGH